MVISVETQGIEHQIKFIETANDVTVFLPSTGSVTVINHLGQTIQVLNGDGGNQSLSKAGLTPGLYVIKATSNTDNHIIIGLYKFIVTY